jgi:hypothetical protein
MTQLTAAQAKMDWRPDQPPDLAPMPVLRDWLYQFNYSELQRFLSHESPRVREAVGDVMAEMLGGTRANG